MDPLTEILIPFGVNIASNVIYDFFKGQFASSRAVDRTTLKTGLVAFLNVENADVVAETIIDFLAQNGDIGIRGSRIFAKKSIFYGSQVGTKFSLEGSTSQTDKTRIIAGRDARIVGQGGAQVRQNEDGSITFHV